MRNTATRTLSTEGLAFLEDERMRAALTAIAASVGVTPEEYLLRFEEILSERPEAILGIFEGSNKHSEKMRDGDFSVRHANVTADQLYRNGRNEFHNKSIQ